MANYPLVSAKQVLASTIRSLGYKLPSTYMDDILEWIPEAMGELEVTDSLVLTSTPDVDQGGALSVSNHCVCLPCGLRAIEAVEDERGNRLPLGADVTDISSPSSKRHVGVGRSGEPRVSAFEVNPYQHQTSDGLPTDEPATSFPFLGEDIEPTENLSTTTHYYQVVGNMIQTSFEEGYIKVHYWSIPVDKEGYPLLPDNANFKRAVEWHIIRRLIGSGYEHKVFSYDYANNQFELYAARALSEVSFYTPERAQRLKNVMVRLIPPTNYYEDFGINVEQSEKLYK